MAPDERSDGEYRLAVRLDRRHRNTSFIAFHENIHQRNHNADERSALSDEIIDEYASGIMMSARQ